MKRNTAWVVTGLLTSPIAVIASRFLEARFQTAGIIAAIAVALGLGLLAGYLFRKSWPLPEAKEEE